MKNIHKKINKNEDTDVDADAGGVERNLNVCRHQSGTSRGTWPDAEIEVIRGEVYAMELMVLCANKTLSGVTIVGSWGEVECKLKYKIEIQKNSREFLTKLPGNLSYSRNES